MSTVVEILLWCVLWFAIGAVLGAAFAVVRRAWTRRRAAGRELPTGEPARVAGEPLGTAPPLTLPYPREPVRETVAGGRKARLRFPR